MVKRYALVLFLLTGLFAALLANNVGIATAEDTAPVMTDVYSSSIDNEPSVNSSSVDSEPSVNSSSVDSEPSLSSSSVDSAPTSVSSLSPQPNSTIASLNPKFSLRFYDPDELNSQVILEVDGTNIVPTIIWDGFYEDYVDSCSGEIESVRVGDNYTSGEITAQFPTLTAEQHTIYYRISDKLGNIAEDSYNFFIADTVGPIITDFSPLDGSTIDVIKPVIRATLKDDNSIVEDSVYLSINGVKVDAAYNFLTSAVTYSFPQVLANGAYNVELRAADIFGNTSVKSWTFYVYADRTPPVLSNMSPASGSTIAELAPSISFRFYDPGGIDPASVLIKVDGNTLNASVTYDGIYETYRDSCSGDTYTVRVGNDYTKGVINAQAPVLEQGSHMMYYYVMDKTENIIEGTHVFTVSDTEGPLITDCSPLDGSTTDLIRPIIKAALTEVNGIVADSIYLHINGTRVNAEYNIVTSAVTYSVPQVLDNGIYNVELRAADTLGNVTVKKWSFNVYTDRTPPLLSDMVPASGSTISSMVPTVSFRFYDPGGINPASVLIKVDGSPVNASVTYDGIYETYSDSCTGDTYTVRVGNDYTKGVINAQAPVLEQGSHTMYYYVMDKTENIVEGTYTFDIYDNEGPQIAECYPAAGVTINSDKPTITVKLNESNSIVADSVYLSLDGTKVDFAYNIDTASITYSVTTRLTNGQHSLQFTARDGLGNLGSKTWTFVVAADQTGPVFSNVEPAAGSKVTSTSPFISLNFSDASQVDKNSVVMKLDGAAVNSAIEYQGIYETYQDSCSGDTYTVKVGEDNTKGKIYFQARNLENNQDHFVEISLKDKLGNNTNHNWSFTTYDDLGPQITTLLPLPGSITEEAGTAISSVVCDNNGVDPNKITMTVNGETVGSFDIIKELISYKPSVPLLDGHYTVVVSAYDIYGNFSSVNWGFDIRHLGLPEIKNLSPSPQSGTRTTTPKVSATISDTAGLNISKLSISVDGAALSTKFVPDSPGSIVSGLVYAVPSQALSNGMHTAVVTVFDRSGNKQQKAWQFGVNQFGDMAVGGECSLCHTESIDTIERRHIEGSEDCSLCHGRGIDWDPGCCYCHGHDEYYPPPVRNVPCTQCHNQTFWDVVPTHGSANELNKHDYTLLGENCRKCHSQYLTREHNLYVEGKGVSYSCLTCHQSSDPDVKAAIIGQNRSCTACHGTNADHEQLHKSGLDQTCKTCHGETLTADHLDNRPTLGLDCINCHPVGNDSTSAYTSGNPSCSQCHPEGHGVKLAPKVPSDIPLYPGIEWSEPLDSKIFANEFWMIPEFSVGAKLVVSKRYPDLSGNQVWNFYYNQMTTMGWTLQSPAPGVFEFFNVVFTKDTHKVNISFYGGSNHNDTPVAQQGYRIEMLYK